MGKTSEERGKINNSNLLFAERRKKRAVPRTSEFRLTVMEVAVWLRKLVCWWNFIHRNRVGVLKVSNNRRWCKKAAGLVFFHGTERWHFQVESCEPWRSQQNLDIMLTFTNFRANSLCLKPVASKTWNAQRHSNFLTRWSASELLNEHSARNKHIITLGWTRRISTQLWRWNNCDCVCQQQTATSKMKLKVPRNSTGPKKRAASNAKHSRAQ